MNRFKILLISLLVSSCGSKGMIGHWLHEGESIKIGLILHDHLNCTAYTESTIERHSTLVSKCEYEVQGNDYLVYILKYKGGRHTAIEHVYSEANNSFTLTLKDPEEGEITYVLKQQ